MHVVFLPARRLEKHGKSLSDAISCITSRYAHYGAAATKSRPRCRRNCGLNTTVSNNTENRRSARRFFCISCNNGSSDNHRSAEGVTQELAAQVSLESSRRFFSI